MQDETRLPAIDPALDALIEAKLRGLAKATLEAAADTAHEMAANGFDGYDIGAALRIMARSVLLKIVP